jgi:DNA-binding NarL/FixJ family response regulator
MTGSVLSVRPAVVVTAEQALVAETVAAALSGRGLSASTLGWPTDPRAGGGLPGSPSGLVGLLISDLDSWTSLRTTWQLIAGEPVAWVVVTTAPEGPMWGAALDAGARVVLPGSTGLAALCRALASADRGTGRTVAGRQEKLIHSWGDLVERHKELCLQVESLTPREREVLTMLHAGDRIARIAQLLGVSPVTVRSQVKSVLRKLEVKSQLGAVAALDDLLALGAWSAGELSPNCGMSRSPVTTG